MDEATQEQSWQLALAKRQQAAANNANRQVQNKGAASPADSIAQTGLQLFTRNVILQPLAIDVMGTGGVASLGVSWILLFIYTMVKDFVFGISSSFITDPGDLMFIATPPQALQKLPDWLRDTPRLPLRLVIYPMGLFVVMIYIAIIFAMILPYFIIAEILD